MLPKKEEEEDLCFGVFWQCHVLTTACSSL
jgi:hypothetical protein